MVFRRGGQPAVGAGVDAGQPLGFKRFFLYNIPCVDFAHSVSFMLLLACCNYLQLFFFSCGWYLPPPWTPSIVS